MANNKNVLGFGKNNNDIVQPIGISGVENDKIKTMSLKSQKVLINIFKELKKFNVQLALINNCEISKAEIDLYKKKL